MMAQEIATSVQEGCKLTIVLRENHGSSSIGGPSRVVSCGEVPARYYCYWNGARGHLGGADLTLDFAENASRLGAHAISGQDIERLKAALSERCEAESTTVIVVQTDPEKRVPGYEPW